MQIESFPNELRILESKQQLEGKRAPLAPLVNSEGIIRVGRKVLNSYLPYFLILNIIAVFTCVSYRHA